MGAYEATVSKANMIGRRQLNSKRSREPVPRRGDERPAAAPRRCRSVCTVMVSLSGVMVAGLKRHCQARARLRGRGPDRAQARQRHVGLPTMPESGDVTRG
jgi:hypothetical protein